MADDEPGTGAEGDANAWTPARSAAGTHNPWLIVGVISLATFMEVLDSAIANVALGHIGGSLSASYDQVTWVLTSYLIANAIVIPISGWLSDVIGRKRYYMLSVALFTIASAVCGLAPNLTTLIIARIVQGIGGGGLAPSEQSILADTFPPAKRGQAFAAYAVVVVVAPVLGPALGGYITDNASWHWIFLINVPVGILSLALVHAFVDEPAQVREDRARKLAGGLRVDYIGFILIVLGLGCLEYTLDRGERLDWFGSPQIVASAIVSALALIGLVAWEFNHDDPIVDLRLMKSRNFAITIFIMGTIGLLLYGSTQLIPEMLQRVLGYTATDAGLALTAGGVVTILLMPVVGIVAGRVDTRLLLIPALVVSGLALLNLSWLNGDISFQDAAVARLWQASALPFLFIPISTVAYVGLRPTQTNQASSLLNVSRNIGGSIGIAWAQALLARREQFHQSRLVERINGLNPDYAPAVKAMGSLAGELDRQSAGIALLYQQVQHQATTLAFLDVYRAFAIFVIVVIPFAFLLKRGTAPAGAGH